MISDFWLCGKAFNIYKRRPIMVASCPILLHYKHVICNENIQQDWLGLFLSHEYLLLKANLHANKIHQIRRSCNMVLCHVFVQLHSTQVLYNYIKWIHPLYHLLLYKLFRICSNRHYHLPYDKRLFTSWKDAY